MSNKVTEITVRHIEEWVKLSLSEEERKQAQTDLALILEYADQLKELDTTETEPFSQVFPRCNVFREDLVINADQQKLMLSNAPEARNGQFQVPKTVR